MRGLLTKGFIIAVLISIIVSPTGIVHAGEEDIPRVFSHYDNNIN